MSIRITASVFASIILATSGQAVAQDQAANREAIQKLAFMQGEWVGVASGVQPDGASYSVTQSERIGPLLGGEVMVVEGRGYRPDGSTGFNAFGVISWNAQTNAYEFRSYAQGYSGTFSFTARDNGYVWEIPAGPGVVRYTADITPTTYHEVGEFVMPGQPARRTFEMSLTRRGDTAWPAMQPVSPR